jgi:hypothetical protein
MQMVVCSVGRGAMGDSRPQRTLRCMAQPIDESTMRRLIRFSDAARDAAQNPDTFGLTPEEIVVLNRLIERLDHQIAKARKIWAGGHSDPQPRMTTPVF